MHVILTRCGRREALWRSAYSGILGTTHTFTLVRVLLGF
jgi:hypothetical protein